MIVGGIIELADSPCSSAIVVAGKKDKDCRFCQDFHNTRPQERMLAPEAWKYTTFTTPSGGQ